MPTMVGRLELFRNSFNFAMQDVLSSLDLGHTGCSIHAERNERTGSFMLRLWIREINLECTRALTFEALEDDYLIDRVEDFVEMFKQDIIAALVKAAKGESGRECRIPERIKAELPEVKEKMRAKSLQEQKVRKIRFR